MHIFNIEKDEAIQIINAVAAEYATWCLYCQVEGGFSLAQHSVVWSDREVSCCSKHLESAKHAAANDGHDSDDNPYIQSLSQPTAIDVFNKIFNEVQAKDGA
jgi:hypothetical protein